jgi:hypothetical protein
VVKTLNFLAALDGTSERQESNAEWSERLGQKDVYCAIRGVITELWLRGSRAWT